MLEGQFVNGLDPTIRVELLVNRTSGLGQIIKIAQRIESKNRAIKQIKGSTHQSRGSKEGFTGSKGLRGSLGLTIRSTTPVEKSPSHQG